MQLCDHAQNLRRLMAHLGLTIDEVAGRTGLDLRTVKGLLAGGQIPRAKTLHRLARGLGVSVDELFQSPSLLARRTFDRQSNPQVDEVVAEHPDLFDGWTVGDFDELYSRFGTGGALTTAGTLAVVAAMNRKREVLTKVSLLLECGHAEMLAEIVDVLYRRARLEAEAPVAAAESPPTPPACDAPSRSAVDAGPRH